jgi:transcriptional regulator with XRE-family HTH domain
VISRRVASELSDPEFRNSYKRARVRSKLAYQIKALRKQRDWLQGKLAEIMDKPQSTVSRFEDADYGKLTLETLFEISDAFDLGLVVEFVPYPEFLVRTSNLSPEILECDSFRPEALAFLTGGMSQASHTQSADAVAAASINIETIPGVAVTRVDPVVRSYEANLLTGGLNGG